MASSVFWPEDAWDGCELLDGFTLEVSGVAVVVLVDVVAPPLVAAAVGAVAVLWGELAGVEDALGDGAVFPEHPDNSIADTPHASTAMLVNRIVILLHSSERGSEIRDQSPQHITPANGRHPRG
jgi:hypothetical protein